MYTVLKNTQIVIALLKEYGIRHIVISPGTRNGPFVHSVEEDPYFTCYSVVDERSAAFFALGIARELRTPVVVSCTSSTAACNYYSAVTEAYYSHVPLVLLTSDRNPQFRNQMEKQQIEQVGMYGKMCRKAVDLPLEIRSDEDFWYCERLVNEALLELTHREGGPVQINLPAYQDMKVFTERELPKVTRIHLNELRPPYSAYEQSLPEALHRARKVMLQVGACSPWSEELREKARQFAQHYNCAIVVQHMSNTGLKEALHITAGTDICNCLSGRDPEILITVGGPTQMMYYEKLRKSNVKHWLVSRDGEVHDPTRHLTDLFEVSMETFFDYFNERAKKEWKNDGSYRDELCAALDKFQNTRPALERLTNIYAIREFCKRVPAHSLVSMSILNAIRIVESFPLPEDVEVYANVGAYGIDGCMSSFLGHAASTQRPAYLVIGDLSFLYDMNSIWIRHVSDNVHILLINNHEGIEMHRFFKDHGDLRRHITAGHHATPKGWIEENRFRYYSVDKMETLNDTLNAFIAEKGKCVLEVFTNEPEDTADALRYYSYEANANTSLKSAMKNMLGNEGTYKLKKLMGKL